MCPGVIKTRVNDETSARRDASQKGDSKRVTSEVKGQRVVTSPHIIIVSSYGPVRRSIRTDLLAVVETETDIDLVFSLTFADEMSAEHLMSRG
ncbi:hypothetical protein F2P81_021718 [Scophthalmus maximus]|uniref:Uncharacterized protein n=1 Tax=Scophthalmus maximus TaxID=52904 RepID=A0A6A4S7A5_SCOMX|nr:hypothetical protein F2P81_021718 [Scophthalmus maximus]